MTQLRRVEAWLEKPVVALLGILVLGIAAYYPALGYPYIQDAVAAVERNPLVLRGDLTEIFTSDYWKVDGGPNNYRPVSVLSFAAERRITGKPVAAVSHAVNVLLHQLSAVLLYVLCRRLGGRPRMALLAAWAFTLHPVMLQGVLNIVGRADVLALLFSLAALVAFTGTAGPRPRLAAWLTALLLFLALGSKEVAAATPGILLLQAVQWRRKDRTKDPASWVHWLGTLAPCALAMTLFLDLRTRALGVFPGLQAVAREDNVLVGLDGVASWATALSMLARYTGLLLFPVKLSPDYSGTAIRIQESFIRPAPLFGAIVLALTIVLGLLPWITARIAKPSQRLGVSPTVVAMGAWMFLLPYLVVGNLLVLNAAGFAERLLYVPAAGFCVMLAWILTLLMHRLPALRGWVLVGFAVALIGAVVQVHVQGRMWASPLALMEQAVRQTPRSLRANQALAHNLRMQGRQEQAVSLFRHCADLDPDDPGTWSDLGIALAQSDDYAAAETALRRAIELDPRRGEAWAYLGAVLRRTGRVVEAEPALRKSLLWRPDMTTGAAELAHLLLDSGRYREAAFYYRGCLQRGRKDLAPYLQRTEELAARAP